MIRRIKDDEYITIKNLVKENRFLNPYLYIDVSTEGFINSSVDTYLVESNGIIFCIIYFYHNSIQLLGLETLTISLRKELAKYIDDKNIKRVTGPREIINDIFLYMPRYHRTDGYIMLYKTSDINCCQVEKASLDELHEIAEIIYSDKHLGIGYTFDNLLEQLSYRMLYKNCNNYIIKKDNKIVSHFASYAVAEDFVILSGMVTRPEYRGRGYGSILVKALSSDVVLKDKKTPLLYCYENEYYTWYQKLGYQTIGTSSKLEIK